MLPPLPPRIAIKYVANKINLHKNNIGNIYNKATKIYHGNISNGFLGIRKGRPYVDLKIVDNKGIEQRVKYIDDLLKSEVIRIGEKITEQTITEKTIINLNDYLTRFPNAKVPYYINSAKILFGIIELIKSIERNVLKNNEKLCTLINKHFRNIFTNTTLHSGEPEFRDIGNIYLNDAIFKINERLQQPQPENPYAQPSYY